MSLPGVAKIAKKRPKLLQTGLLTKNDLWMQNSNRANKYFIAVFEKNNKQCDCGAAQTK